MEFRKANFKYRIYTENGEGEYCIIGQVQIGDLGFWYPAAWNKNGKHIRNSLYDLIPVIKILGEDISLGQIVYEDGIEASIYPSKAVEIFDGVNNQRVLYCEKLNTIRKIVSGRVYST